MKIGILTIFNGNHNYGGMLQAFALNKKITDLGHDAYTLNYEYGGNPLYPTLLSRCKQYSLLQIANKLLEVWTSKKYLIADKLKKRHELFNKFSLDNIKQTERYADYEKLGADFEALVVGSDQVWNPNMMRKPLILDITTDARKISYAASIGRDALSEYERKYMFPLIKKFDAVGVREESLRKILLSGNINATTVLDPTLLLEKEEWNNVCSGRLIKEPYVFIYSFSDCHIKKEIQNYWKAKGVKVVYIPYAKQSYNRFDCKNDMIPIFDAGPAEFLSLIKYAEHVYTDSFHGTVFSILFEKQFSVYERSRKKSKVSMNSRIYDVLDCFSLNDRLIKTDYMDEDVKIDYNKVTDILKFKRDESVNWLKKALE